MTGIFASASADTVRKNAMRLPAYTLLLTPAGEAESRQNYLARRKGRRSEAYGFCIPALNFGLYPGWFRAQGLIVGWVAGFSGGTWLAWATDFKLLHTLHFGSASVMPYSSLLALAANIPLAILVSAVLRFSSRGDCRSELPAYCASMGFFGRWAFSAGVR